MSLRQILKGATDQSVIIRIVDSGDGTPETGVTSATSGLDLKYRREGAVTANLTESDLSALNDAHSDGGMLHIGAGYYRVDVPDAAFATGANGVLVFGTVTGMVVIGCYVHLVDYDPQNAVRLGLTALPNAAAEASGGLYTRGSGAGQINQPANGMVDVNAVRHLGTAYATPSVAGVPEVDITHVRGATDWPFWANGYTWVGAAEAGTLSTTQATSSLKTANYAELVDDIFKGWEIMVRTSGAAPLYQSAIVTGFIAATGRFTWAPAMTAAMTASDQFQLRPANSGFAVGDRTGNLSGSAGSVTAGVTVSTNNDKTGYALSAAGVQAIWDALTSALTTAGSIGKLLVDNVNATISSRAAGSLFTGITSVAEWLGLIAGKQTGNSTARTELRATGAGSGSYDETTDSLEAQRDNVGTNGAALSLAKGSQLTGFNDLSAAQVQSEAEDALIAHNLDHLVKSAVDTNFATTVHADSVIGQIADNGAGFDRTTDSLEAIRDRGDAAWADSGTPPTAAAIADAVWDEATAGHTTSGTFGEQAKTDIDAILADTNELQADWVNGGRLDNILDARASQTSVDDLPTNAELATALAGADDAVLAAIAALNNLSQADVRTAVGLATNNLDTQLDALPTALENADALLKRDWSAVTGEATRSALNALRFLRNKWSIAGGTLTVTEEDDATPAWTGAVTQTAGNPVSEIDPA